MKLFLSSIVVLVFVSCSNTSSNVEASEADSSRKDTLAVLINTDSIISTVELLLNDTTGDYVCLMDTFRTDQPYTDSTHAYNWFKLPKGKIPYDMMPQDPSVSHFSDFYAVEKQTINHHTVKLTVSNGATFSDGLMFETYLFVHDVLAAYSTGPYDNRLYIFDSNGEVIKSVCEEFVLGEDSRKIDCPVFEGLSTMKQVYSKYKIAEKQFRN